MTDDEVVLFCFRHFPPQLPRPLCPSHSASMGDLTEEMQAAMEALIDQGMSVADALRHVRDSASAIADVFSAYVSLSDDAFLDSVSSAPPLPLAPAKDWWDSLLEPESGQLPAIGEEGEEDDDFNPFLSPPAPPTSAAASSTSASTPTAAPAAPTPEAVRQFSFRNSLRRSITRFQRNGSTRGLSSMRRGGASSSSSQKTGGDDDDLAQLNTLFAGQHQETISEATREAAAVAAVLGTLTAIESDVAKATSGEENWWGDLDTLMEDEAGSGSADGDDSSNPFLAFQRSFRQSLRRSLKQTRSQSIQRRSTRSKQPPTSSVASPKQALSPAEALEKDRADNLALRAGLLALENAESDLLAMYTKDTPSAPQHQQHKQQARTSSPSVHHEEGSQSPDASLIRQRSKAISMGSVRGQRNSSTETLSSSPQQPATQAQPTSGSEKPPLKHMGSREEAKMLLSIVAKLDQDDRSKGTGDDAEIDLDMYRNINEKPLSDLVQTGDLSEESALTAARWVDKELRKLIKAIQDFGRRSALGNFEANFGVLYEKTRKLFDAASLDGILSAARSQGIVTYSGERLRPIHDDLTIITLINPSIKDSSASTCIL